MLLTTVDYRFIPKTSNLSSANSYVTYAVYSLVDEKTKQQTSTKILLQISIPVQHSNFEQSNTGLHFSYSITTVNTPQIMLLDKYRRIRLQNPVTDSNVVANLEVSAAAVVLLLKINGQHYQDL
jgi:hypothetical protein